MKTVDLGTITWQKYGVEPYALFYATVPDGRTLVGVGNRQSIVIDGYDCKQTALNGSAAIYLPTKTACWDATNSQILMRDNAYTDAASFKQAMQGVILIYETANSVEEMFISNPTIIYKNSGWGNNWDAAKNYLNTIKPGVYNIIMRATLTQKKPNFDQGSNMWGIYTPTKTQNIRYTWPASAQVGDTVERRNTLRVQPTPFNNFYVYGCGRNGLGDTGTANIELTIINPYMEVIQ